MVDRYRYSELIIDKGVGEREGEAVTERYCPQCCKHKRVEEFIGRNRNHDRLTIQCKGCRDRFRLPPEKRPRLTWRDQTPDDELLRVNFTRYSQNIKTGPIPVSTSSPSTCPKSCSWYGRGCYAESGWMGGRWKRTVLTGLYWHEFLDEIRYLPVGQIWRHNEAGDLSGHDEHLDRMCLRSLVEANKGRRGFTYTHKCTEENRDEIEQANRDGFTINISCDNIDEVDERIDEGVELPLTLVVRSDYPQHTRTPKNRAHVIVCPAQVTPITCEKCKLCAIPNRKSVIAFRAHGGGASLVSLNATNLSLFD